MGQFRLVACCRCGSCRGAASRRGSLAAGVHVGTPVSVRHPDYLESLAGLLGACSPGHEAVSTSRGLRWDTHSSPREGGEMTGR